MNNRWQEMSLVMQGSPFLPVAGLIKSQTALPSYFLDLPKTAGDHTRPSPPLSLCSHQTDSLLSPVCVTHCGSWYPFGSEGPFFSSTSETFTHASRVSLSSFLWDIFSSSRRQTELLPLDSNNTCYRPALWHSAYC